METSKTLQIPRGTDRVLEALSTLAALLDRTINEVKGLDSDFQNRLTQSVREAEASFQSLAAQNLEVALADARAKLEEEFRTRIAELSTQWDDERGRLNSELSKTSQTIVQWETERSRLMGELERMSRVQAATQAEAEKAIMAMKAASAAAKNSKGISINGEVLNTEIERVEGLVKQISSVIEDPAAELSTVIRKNVERAELESYLRGIRFALNGTTPK
jgi:Tfp pilus assembly protein PilP